MIGSELIRYAENRRFVVWDLETESLNLRAARPWQIAYAICTIKGIESTHVHYPLWPDLAMSADAAEITRFDMKDYLSRAEPADKILAAFEEVVTDSSVWNVGHNIVSYDAYVLDTWRRLTGRPTDWSLLNRSVDTLALSRAYRYQQTPDRTNLLAWQYRMLSMRGSRAKGMGCSLGAMAREFGVEYDERRAHSADYDIAINWQVATKLFWAVEV